jgi:hypothetical protein
MKPVVKKVLLGAAALLGLGALGAGGFVMMQVKACDDSMAKVYDTPLPNLKASTDEAVIARGKHLVQGVGGCASKDCHGKDLAGGNSVSMGPVGTMTGPNITPGGAVATYSDGELARLIRYGIKKDGRSAQFMPSQEVNWMPDDELTAVVSYLRTVPKSDKPNGPLRFSAFAKVLDRQGKFDLDVARKIASSKVELAGKPEPTAAYGRFLAKACTGCHGETFSGGPIPGSPPSMPVPLNITPHETGMKGWTYEDFDKLMVKGDRKNGQKLNAFMPIDAFGNADETEKKALFAYLQTLPPRPFGGR